MPVALPALLMTFKFFSSSFPSNNLQLILCPGLGKSAIAMTLLGKVLLLVSSSDLCRVAWFEESGNASLMGSSNSSSF